MRRDIRPGAVFPDYELTDHNWGRPSVEDVRRDLPGTVPEDPSRLGPVR